MPGLSAKVFRTYNASITLCSELAKTDQFVTDQQRAKEGDLVALNNYYAIANKNVAILCNHQKAASASHDTQVCRQRPRANTGGPSPSPAHPHPHPHPHSHPHPHPHPATLTLTLTLTLA